MWENFMQRSIMPSAFVRGPHPTASLPPEAALIKKFLTRGWIAQKKMNGARIQIHVPANPALPLVYYTRQGTVHTKAMNLDMEALLRTLLAPAENWNIVEGEWIRATGRIFLFDTLMDSGRVLSREPYIDRYRRLPRDFISPTLKVLSIIRTTAEALKVLLGDDVLVEGLVLKAEKSPSLDDDTIVRCRKSGL